jgi:DNA-binding NarL/FixJ family response regulator
MTIRVLLVDDHPIVRAGLKMVLGIDPTIEVVAEGANGVEAVELAELHQPDLVLMDLQMPELDGVEATASIRASYPDVHVVILTTYDSDRSIVSALDAGAAGYLLKDAPPDELLRAIKAAATGQPVVSDDLAERVQAQRDAMPLDPLTERETEVLQCVAQGLSNPKIAEALFVSQATVKTHLIHVFQKLQVKDRTSAVTKALNLGLIELDEPR